MDSEEKGNSADFESDNEDDALLSGNSEDDCGEFDEEEDEKQEPDAAKQKADSEFGQPGASHEAEYIEGDGELCDGDDNLVLVPAVEKSECGEENLLDCKVEDVLDDENHAEFIQSLKVWGNADHIERELVKMPSAESAVDEVKCSRENRVITVYPFSLEDCSNPKYLAALREKGCEEIRLQFVRPEENPDEWTGFLLLNCKSISSASRVAEELKSFRDDVDINIQIQGSSSSRFNIRRWKASVKGKHRWCDGLLMVKNIGESTTESKLSALFPGASILLHRESSPTSDGALKGFAYVVYPMKEGADAALAKYKGKKITVDGRRLLVMRYFNPEKTALPEGMLRLGERRLVMHNINELNDMIRSTNRDVTPLQGKVKALQELIDKDDCVRRQIGLPTPSFDRLKKMNSLRQFSEREKTAILQRLLIPSLSALPPPKVESPKPENGEKSSMAKTGQSRKRKNRGNKSSKETAVTSNLNMPRPVLPLPRLAFVPQVPQPSPGSSLPARAPLPLMLRDAAFRSRLGTSVPANLPPPALGNWMRPPPSAVPSSVQAPAVGPLGTQPVSRVPVLVPPPAVAATVPPPHLIKSPPARLPLVPPPAPFVRLPQRSFSPGVPPWRVPPPSANVRPLVRTAGEVLEPPLKLARFNRPARPVLGSLPWPKFGQHPLQRRF